MTMPLFCSGFQTKVCFCLFLIACFFYSQAVSAFSADIPAVWLPLAGRLEKDGLSGPAVDRLLSGMGPVITQSPMGRKITELYNRQFYPKPKNANACSYYKGVVTDANAILCRKFIKNHEKDFLFAQNRYGVSAAVACALLFVETRLGKVLGDVPENALYTLASMASSTTLNDIDSWLAKLQNYNSHIGWIEDTMVKRSNWAYAETRALIKYIINNNIEPDKMPGSVYGAVGLCQFMPSNIEIYGADGNNDGSIDLFNPADAIASLANYLKRHGWNANLSRQGKHRVLMTYNHSAVYANTILALSDLIEGRKLQTVPKKAVPK